MISFELEYTHLYKTATLGEYTNYPLIFVARDKKGTLYMCHLIRDETQERQLRYVAIELTKDLSDRIDEGLNIQDAYLEAKTIYEVQVSQTSPIIAWETERDYEIRNRIGNSITKKKQS